MTTLEMILLEDCRHVTCGRGMLAVGRACYLWVGHVTCGQGMLPVGGACYLWAGHVACGQGTLPVGRAHCLWMEHVICGRGNPVGPYLDYFWCLCKFNTHSYREQGLEGGS